MRKHVKKKVINEIQKNEKYISDVIKEGYLEFKITFDFDIFKEKSLFIYSKDGVITLDRIIGRAIFIERNEMKFKKEGNEVVVEVYTKHFY